MRFPGFLVAIIVLLAGGCATAPRVEPAATASASDVRPAWLTMAPDPQVEERVLAIDPERVTDSDVRALLAAGTTPRIIGLHGGIYPVHLLMDSFGRFLVGMGYPDSKIRHPGDGRRSHSPYEDSEQIAGAIAWYYEKEGLMPMLIGHSQGGIQLVKVLYDLAGKNSPEIKVWNPTADAAENRVTIIDPYSGLARPVVGLKVGYASVVGAGGAALLLPNQWSMAGRLRSIPDSVEDFTGYAIGVDLVAWDVPGSAKYRSNGSARVRNVELPADYSHVFVTAASPLARDPAMREWINAYVPGTTTEPPAVPGSHENALWAADVWYSIKKHWVLESQKAIHARRGLSAAKR